MGQPRVSQTALTAIEKKFGRLRKRDHFCAKHADAEIRFLVYPILMFPSDFSYNVLRFV